MAYIGTKPTIGNFQICDAISVVNGQAAYTMQVGGVNVSPQSSNHMIVSLNGTIQKPGGANPSFTVSGSTITFASNLATGDVIDFIQILGDVLDLGVPSDGSVTSAKISYPLTTFSSTGIDDNADATAITIDSSGNIGIGNTVASTINSANGTGNLVVGSGSGTEGITIYSGTTGEGTLQFADASTGSATYIGQINYNHSSNDMSFTAGGTERMRLLGTGGVLVGKTSTGGGTSGVQLSTGVNEFVTSSATTAIFNRNTDDGTVISIRQNNTEEGGIDVSGSTVTFNGFTGTHWSRFQDNSTPTILKGTVLETLDEMCDWYNLEFDVITQDDDGNDVTTAQKIPHVLLDSQSDGDVITYNYEGTDYQATIVKENDIKHMKSKVSDTTDAKNVYGVFVAYDLDGEGYNDFYVASVGSFVVRIKANETIAKGDLLQSNGDGTAKVQSDDNIKSSSFAKVLSTTVIETYEDGSFIVPCSLMC
jgi:hypothetical protein